MCMSISSMMESYVLMSVRKTERLAETVNFTRAQMTRHGETTAAWRPTDMYALVLSATLLSYGVCHAFVLYLSRFLGYLPHFCYHICQTSVLWYLPHFSLMISATLLSWYLPDLSLRISATLLLWYLPDFSLMISATLLLWYLPHFCYQPHFWLLISATLLSLLCCDICHTSVVLEQRVASL